MRTGELQTDNYVQANKAFSKYRHFSSNSVLICGDCILHTTRNVKLNNMSESRRDKLLIIPTTLVDGVLAVIGAQVPNLWVSVAILILVCAAQLIAIWRLQTFKRGYVNVLFGGSIVLALSLLWYSNRPTPQPPPLTRTDLQQELETLKPRPTSQVNQSPSPSPSPSASASPDKSKTARERRK